MQPGKLPSILLLSAVAVSLAACVGLVPPRPPMDPGSVEPGSFVSRGGVQLALAGTPIRVGNQLPPTALVAAGDLTEVDLSTVRGKVLFLSIVPSIDTKVCEAQSHYLGEEGDRLPAIVERITISRDTPFAQKRFAEEAKLTDINFLSDYKEGAFGRSLGLLQEDSRLLARAVLLVDGQGVVRYIQVVPELTSLPDMERAFDLAKKLAEETTGQGD